MKTQMQRLQSRISKRRNFIGTINAEIEVLVILKEVMQDDLSEHAKEALKQFRVSARVLGVDQKLDKELYQMLLTQERNKFAGHFKSKYPHCMVSIFEGGIFNG